MSKLINYTENKKRMDFKYFYEMKVEITSFKLELKSLTLSKKEKAHIFELARSTIHFEILDFILNEFEEEDHKNKFMALISTPSSYLKAFDLAESIINDFEGKLIANVKKHEDLLIKMLG